MVGTEPTRAATNQLLRPTDNTTTGSSRSYNSSRRSAAIITPIPARKPTDDHATAASAVLDNKPRLTVATVDLDSTFPLDDGENAVVQLANSLDAPFCYCDEYNRLSLIHASLSATRLVTTPRLLKAFVGGGLISNDTAMELLAGIADVRSWNGNAYVQQATRLFEETE